jgi:prepilin signal peptidase PulO-like enzyme (type II secretory pathway)
MSPLRPACFNTLSLAGRALCDDGRHLLCPPSSINDNVTGAFSVLLVCTRTQRDPICSITFYPTAHATIMWVGLLFNAFFGPVSSQDAIVGAAAGYLILWLLYWLVRLIYHKGSRLRGFQDACGSGRLVRLARIPVIAFT